MRTMIAIGMLLLAQGAASRCIDARYEITGKVVDPSGAAVASANVVASWQELIAIRKESVISKADGSFRFIVIYTPFSGSSSIGSDLCERKLDKIKIVASKAGFTEVALELEPSSQNLKANIVLQSATPNNTDG
jgi:hypothetical protein